MAPLLPCEFDMDTICIELQRVDGAMISIDCCVIEDDVAKTEPKVGAGLDGV